MDPREQTRFQYLLSNLYFWLDFDIGAARPDLRGLLAIPSDDHQLDNVDEVDEVHDGNSDDDDDNVDEVHDDDSDDDDCKVHLHPST